MAELQNKVVFLSDKKTSIRLAVAEWDAVDNICARENIKRNDLIETINRRKDPTIGLTCSVRLFTIIYFYQLLVYKQQNYASNAKLENPIFEAINGIL